MGWIVGWGIWDGGGDIVGECCVGIFMAVGVLGLIYIDET